MRNRLPLAISITALVVAVLGTTPLGQAAYNAVLPINSVGALQLRGGAVTEAKIRGDAVTSGKVKNHSLKSIDFADGQIPAGPAGAKGDKGDKGEPGATKVVIRQGVVTTFGSGQANRSVMCVPGEVAVGGGAGPADGGGNSAVTIRSSGPTPVGEGKTPTGWQGTWSYTAAGLTLAVWVVCAKP